MLKAKEQGKVRFFGFTGHKDPDLHLAMLDTGFPFDAVQMPLNPFDSTFMSFEQKVLPVLNQRGIAPLGMKPIGGHGEPVQKGVLTAQEALRYAMSLPVATTITGVEEMHILEQNLQVAQNFSPMSRTRCRPFVNDADTMPEMDASSFIKPQSSSTTPRLDWLMISPSTWPR